MKKTILALIIFIIVVIVGIAGYFGAQYYLGKNFSPEYFFVHPTVSKIFGITPVGIYYKNAEFGFSMIFSDKWNGFIVQKNKWEGWKIDSSGKIGDYSGVELLFKNSQTTSTQQWQDIPIMVFSHDVWTLVDGPNATVAVSAAPIGPEKIGENSKYIFATPPRWYGFTDAVGFQEAVDIVKTFKAF